jgi:hypothetical protein
MQPNCTFIVVKMGDRSSDKLISEAVTFVDSPTKEERHS